MEAAGNELDGAALYCLRDVDKTYNGRSVLRIANLEVRRGEILGIVGPSGAGKSTMLRLLAFLELPTSGDIVFSGRLCDGEWPPLALRRRVTMLFQDPQLLRRSVYENIAYGLSLRKQRDDQEKINSMIAALGLSELRNAQARTLSGGEAQRVALARSLVLQPEVLLLDEPTSNLDPSNIKLIEEMIMRANQESGMTAVMVTHNIFQARRLASRVCLILGGELVEVAETTDFFERPQSQQTAAFVHGDMVY